MALITFLLYLSFFGDHFRTSFASTSFLKKAFSSSQHRHTCALFIILHRSAIVTFFLHSRAELPLPPDVPMEFAALPEFYLEDIADYLLFVLQ